MRGDIEDFSAAPDSFDLVVSRPALLELGCSLSQGFHFARPQSAADLEQLLEIDTLGEFAA